jgi:NAD(P)H-nitrite reductase large subunit
MVHHIIIGNGIAGSTAAETLRENDKECDITLIGDEKYPLYSRMNLENYVAGDCEKKHIIMKTKDWYHKMKIDLKLNTKVRRVNPKRNYVILKDGKRLSYDKLLIATGGTPRKLKIPGSNLKGVHCFQTFDDAIEIIESTKGAKKAAIIGGSFIGADSAVALKKLGIETTIIVRANRYWYTFLDEVGSKIIHNIMEKNGVRIVFDEEAVEFIGDKRKLKSIYTTKGRYIEADLVIVGIGLIRNVDFLADIDVNVRDGIVVNKYLQTTTYPDIFAAGDVTEFYDVYINQWITHGNWSNAMQQGRVAAMNMLGKKEVFDDISQYTTDIFGVPLMTVGDVELETKDVILEVDEKKMEYKKIFLKDKRVVGAIFIGDISPFSRVLKLIVNKTRVSGKDDVL